MSCIIISGKKFSYTLIHKSVRSLSLRVKSRRSFAVVSPRLLPGFMINRFIGSHTNWILRNSAKFSKKISLKNLKSLQILDSNYEMLITKSTRESVVIFKDEYKIYANSTSLLNSHLKKLFDTKFRPFALSLIKTELQKLSSLYGFEYRRVSVKNTTSRFGSCSHTNNLNFNWQIILFPVEIFRHVLLHELTHLTIKNHSKEFWGQLSVYDPNSSKHNLWLKQKASKHFLIHP